MKSKSMDIDANAVAQLQSFLDELASDSQDTPSFCSYFVNFVKDNGLCDLPDNLLVRVWMAIQDEAYGYISNSSSMSMSTEEWSNILELMELLLNQCPNLSSEEFLEECIADLVAKANDDLRSAVQHIVSVRGLLADTTRLLVKGGLLPLFRASIEIFGEAKVARTWLLLKLLFGNAAFGDVFSGIKFFRNVPMIQAGFQLVAELAQLPILHDQEEPTYESAWALLNELQQLNEGKWLACYAAVLHQMLSTYFKNGPTALEDASVKPLLLLLSRPCLASTFLDSIIICSELHGSVNRSVINAAFQIFELAYKEDPLTILRICATKLASSSSDNVSIRLECLAVLARIQKMQVNGSSDGLAEWPSEVTKAILASVLHDASVRVRRSAMQLLSQIEPTETDEEEFLATMALKVRDKDEKLRAQALENMCRFSMQTLACFLKRDHWKAIFENTLTAPEGSQVHYFAEKLLIDYLTSDKMQGSPSDRLKVLDFAAEDKYSLYSKCVEKHIRRIFQRELECIQCINQEQQLEHSMALQEETDTLLPVISQQFCSNSRMDLVLSKVEVWSWGNYNVTDTFGNFFFRVEGRLSLRWTRTILDRTGKRVLRIHKKMLVPGILDAFIDDAVGDSKRVFKVHCSSACPPRFSLKVFLPSNTEEAEPDFKLEGTYFENEYAVYCGDRVIAEARRKPDASSFVLGCGAYTITVLPGADYVFILSLILIMDEIHLEASVGHD